MSSSFGGGGQGQIKYVISVDDSQAIQKLQGVGQALGQLGQGTQQATQQLQQAPEALQEITINADKVTISSNNATQAFERQGQKAKEAGQQQQSFGQVMKNNVANILQVGTGILSLVSNYTSLQRSQLAINKLQVTETNQRRLLGVLTRQHAAAVQKYGANSQEALDIENKDYVMSWAE